jgi:hypothetical protein
MGAILTDILALRGNKAAHFIAYFQTGFFYILNI